MAQSAQLGEHLENYVESLVSTGRFRSRDEVLREGVRLLEEREKRLITLDAAIERGIADMDSGRSSPVAEVEDRLVEKYGRMTADRQT
ncbi:type II toxin-antitoxin system ParD family antitoxin [Rhizobium sp. CC-YZS058]|uniref:type II toxin-antitoxin system ParD family antitoxin n=1 Tax=Rhizobium sp. CC-YZS058 TaxID=3042153 RepID=UPI002B052A76|nr:type II toxin-antitoxin system ParD family antitoxin [Rhizobium sp. CC-YZS058]MEA3536304.1 type II toxin-antitoxin system ParD family antitoxin [Rhizobium sp. CC-YZS058]